MHRSLRITRATRRYLRLQSKAGCRGWTRTSVRGFRDRSPATRRPGKRWRRKVVLPHSRISPTPLFSKQRPRLVGFSLQMAENGGLAPQPAHADPAVFETAAAPRRLRSPNWRKAEGMLPNGWRRPARFQRATAPRRLNLPNGPRGRTPTGNRAFEERDDLCFTTRGKWRARPDSHRDYSALGPRPTVCCRRAQSLRGRSCTCVQPLRRRRPGLLEARGVEWRSRQDLHLQPRPSEGRALSFELREQMGPRLGIAPSSARYKGATSLATLTGQTWFGGPCRIFAGVPRIMSPPLCTLS